MSRYQPLVALHGHIHESMGRFRLGRTQCFNPGSEYVQGTLNGWIVALKGAKLTGYQHTAGDLGAPGGDVHGPRFAARLPLMRERARTVVVGAGIVGASAAYHLAELGEHDVLVLDQGPLFETGGSSSHAPGLAFQTNGSRMMCRIAQESVALYARRWTSTANPPGTAWAASRSRPPRRGGRS